MLRHKFPPQPLTCFMTTVYEGFEVFNKVCMTVEVLIDDLQEAMCTGLTGKHLLVSAADFVHFVAVSS